MTTKPLAGIRVADFSWVWAGPFCTLQLAHLGAEVIRVESATRPCVTRFLPPFAEFQPGVNRSGYFNQYNQGKKSITIDLKSEKGLEIARKLIASSDVVAENFAFGVMDRMGLGWEDLQKIKPGIILVSLSGYGRSGPERDCVSYGPATVPLSGYSAVTGYAGAPPMHVGISYGDPTTGVHGAFAVLAALHHRDETGEGQWIDGTLWETGTALLPEAILARQMSGEDPSRDGNRDRQIAPHGVFHSAGGDEWVAIVARDDAEWRRMAEVMGRAELASDPRFATMEARKRNEDALDAEITAWTRGRSAEDATKALQAKGIAASPSMTNHALHDDAHLAARDFWVELPHTEIGVKRHVGIPWRLSDTPCRVERAAPCVGEHTREVLEKVLGYSTTEIDALDAAGVLR